MKLTYEGINDARASLSEMGVLDRSKSRVLKYVLKSTMHAVTHVRH
jgi:hypothetical protein